MDRSGQGGRVCNEAEGGGGYGDGKRDIWEGAEGGEEQRQRACHGKEGPVIPSPDIHSSTMSRVLGPQ